MQEFYDEVYCTNGAAAVTEGTCPLCKQCVIQKHTCSLRIDSHRFVVLCEDNALMIFDFGGTQE